LGEEGKVEDAPVVGAGEEEAEAAAVAEDADAEAGRMEKGWGGSRRKAEIRRTLCHRGHVPVVGGREGGREGVVSKG